MGSTKKQLKIMRRTERRLLRAIRKRGIVWARPRGHASAPGWVRAARRLARDGRVFVRISKFDLFGDYAPWTFKEIAIAEEERRVAHYPHRLGR